MMTRRPKASQYSTLAQTNDTSVRAVCPYAVRTLTGRPRIAADATSVVTLPITTMVIRPTRIDASPSAESSSLDDGVLSPYTTHLYRCSVPDVPSRIAPSRWNADAGTAITATTVTKARKRRR